MSIYARAMVTNSIIPLYELTANRIGYSCAVEFDIGGNPLVNGVLDGITSVALFNPGAGAKLLLRLSFPSVGGRRYQVVTTIVRGVLTWRVATFTSADTFCDMALIDNLGAQQDCNVANNQLIRYFVGNWY